jgi:hypothetical protein
VVGESGLPFFMLSSYIGGCDFIGNEKTIIYAKNDSGVPNGGYSLHKAIIDDSTVSQDIVIKKSSKNLLRPASDDNGSLMYMIGSYNDVSTKEQSGSFLDWQLSLQFLDMI